MAILNKIALENSQGVQTEYDIGASATNVAYDNQASIKDKVDTVASNLSTHTNSASASATGAHGLRYYNNKLQTYDTTQSEWVDIPTGGAEDVGLSVVNGRICVTYTEV